MKIRAGRETSLETTPLFKKQTKSMLVHEWGGGGLCLLLLDMTVILIELGTFSESTQHNVERYNGFKYGKVIENGDCYDSYRGIQTGVFMLGTATMLNRC